MTPKEKVYNFISEQLTQGTLTREDKLTETFLAENTGLSRTPVREALLQLAADNILDREPNKGFKLKHYSQEDVENIYQIIGVLDGKIAYEVCELLSDTDYATMQFLIDSMYSAIKNSLYTKYNELQEQFHQVYTNYCKNTVLTKDLLDKKKIFIGKTYSRVDAHLIQNVLMTTNDEHQTILNLFMQHKRKEVRDFLEYTHWNVENAQYDIW